MYTQCSFDHYRGEDCMKKFAYNLKDHVSIIIINYEQKRI